MEWACRTARWPAVLRTERLQQHSDQGVFRAGEGVVYLRRAMRDVAKLLNDGRVLAVFPEAYPTIDPRATPRAHQDAFLPFRRGLAGLVERARQGNHTPIPVIPAGLTYQGGRRWHVTLRFGPRLFLDAYDDRSGLMRAVEEQVRLLSGLGQGGP